MEDSKALRNRLIEAESAVALVPDCVDLEKPDDAVAVQEVSNAWKALRNCRLVLEREEWPGRSVGPYPKTEEKIYS